MEDLSTARLVLGVSRRMPPPLQGELGMRFGRWVVSALLALTLVGCSNKPSDAEAERLFGEQNASLNVAEIFRFENARRINGYEQDGKRYVVEMQFEVVTKMDYEEVVDALRRDTPDNFLARAQLTHNIEILEKEYGRFKKGDRFTKKRPMVLQRAESGWVLAK